MAIPFDPQSNQPHSQDPRPRAINVEQHVDIAEQGATIIGVNISAETAYDVHGLPNPFLGLQSFTYADRAKYGGRTHEIADAVAKLTDPASPLALLFVTGASGSGKSSFAQAGLLPALVAHYGEATTRWAVFRPAQNPLAGLSDALWRRLDLPQLAPAQVNAQSFADHVRAYTPARQVNLIVVDQFEELFTQSAPQSRDKLFDILAHLPSFPESRTHIIATLRADYLPELFAIPAVYEVAKRGVDLRAMNISALREAIQQPLQVAYPDGQKRFEPELVERLARDAAEDAAYLPLLQVTLEEMWTRGSLMLGAYSNLTDAIKQRADKVLLFGDYDNPTPVKARTEAEQNAILDLLLALVDVSADDDARRDVRRRRPLDELAAQSPEHKRLIEDLTRARLLTQTRAADDETCVEVDLIHETLLTNWERLRAAIAERRQQLRQRARFEQRLRDWLSGHSDLLDGVSLAEANALDERGDIALRRQEAQDFLKVSNAQAELERQKELADARRVAEAQKRATGLLRWVVIVLLLGVMGSAGGGLFALQQRNDAVTEANARATAEANAIHEQQISFSRELAASAIGQLTSDPEVGLLLSIESVKVSYTTQAEDALRQALLTSLMGIALRGHTGPVTSAAFSPDGKQVVTASYYPDHTARIWEAGTGRQLAVLQGHMGPVMAAAYSPDGKQIVTASFDGTARVWEASTGREVTVLSGHTSLVISAAYSPDGKQIVTGSNDQTARIWDVMTGQAVATLQGHTGDVRSVAYSPDGKQIVTASTDRTARIWEASTGRQLSILHPDFALGAAYSPDGTRIVTASRDNTARIWEASTGRQLLILQGHTNWVNSATYSPDGKRIVTSSADRTARIWDASTGHELVVLRGHAAPVNSAAYSPDGKQIVTASDDQTARIWETSAGREVTILRGHTDSVNSAAYSPDGRQIVTASSDHTARLWDARTWQTVASLQGHAALVYSAAFSPDGRRIATSSYDQSVRVWDAQTGQIVASLQGHTAPVHSVAYSPDGTQILTASADRTVRVWDAITGRELTNLRVNITNPYSAIFSPDGKQIVTASEDQTARIWEAGTGRELLVLRGHTSIVRSAAYSPDGRQIVSASNDQTARIWDAETGNQLTVLRGHTSPVTSAAFSPDGKQIVTASDDQTARVWDAKTGRQLTVLRGHTGIVMSAAYSPDGTQIVTASEDGVAHVFLAHIEDLLALAQTRITRQLTCTERNQFLHEPLCPAATPTP